MDVRVAQRYSRSETSLPSQTAHAISQKSIPSSLSHSSNRNSRQRWSGVPSSLAIVETIEYDTDDSESVAATAAATRESSKVQLRGLVRQLFAWKEKDVSSAISTTPNPAAPRSLKNPKKDLIVAKNSEQKEGNRWNRFSIIVRPAKQSEQSTPPKRVDSGVDVRTLKEFKELEQEKDAEREREKGRRKSSLNTIYSSGTSIRSAGSSFQTAVTSRSSFASEAPSSSPLDLTQSQLDELLLQIKTGTALLNAQAAEAETFSKNLAGQLWSKEHSVTASKYLPPETKTAMLATLGKVREQTARTFCRKGIFFERSLAVLAKMQGVVEAARNGEHDISHDISPSSDNDNDNDNNNNNNESTARSSSPISDTTTLTNEKSHSCPPRLTLHLLQSSLQTLKADLTAHSHLDPALRNTVVLPTQENRFPSTEKERVAMRRFARFVDGRVKKMGEGYWAMGRWVRAVDSWVDDLVEE